MVFNRRNKPEDESRVADAVDDESFLARVRSRFAQEIETDQQIAAEPHAFPADEKQQQIIRQHQDQHGEHEQVQIAEEAVVAALVGHVAAGIDVDQESHAGDYAEHHRRQRIEQHAPLRVEENQPTGRDVHGAGGHPIEQHDLHETVGSGAGNELHDGPKGKDHRQANAAHAHGGDGPIRNPPPDEKHGGRARQRKQRNQPDVRQKELSRHRRFPVAAEPAAFMPLTISEYPFRPPRPSRDCGRRR